MKLSDLSTLTAESTGALLIFVGIIILVFSVLYLRCMSSVIGGVIVTVSGILFKILVDERIIDPLWRPFLISLSPFRIEGGVIMLFAFTVLFYILGRLCRRQR